MPTVPAPLAALGCDDRSGHIVTAVAATAADCLQKDCCGISLSCRYVTGVDGIHLAGAAARAAGSADADGNANRGLVRSGPGQRQRMSAVAAATADRLRDKAVRHGAVCCD